MSRFIKHTACPACREHGQDRSGNNLGVWEDHKYCFSCGFHEGDTSRSKMRRFAEKVNGGSNEIPQCGIAYPEDATEDIRHDALTWVKSYGITNYEISYNNFLWSERKELLIFPFYGSVTGIGHNDLIAWQGRYFGPYKEYPKYVTYGIRQDVFNYCYPLGFNIFDDTTLVIVEDLISAIKVSRHVSTIPLFSSDANKYQLFKMAHYYKHAIIWLDPDKHQHAIKLKQRAESFFTSVRVVLSDKDPKDYTDKEIINYVG